MACTAGEPRRYDPLDVHEVKAGARLLFVSKGEDAAPTRYRALQFFTLLREAGFDPQHESGSGGLQSYLRVLKAARRSDIVVVLRKTYPLPLLWLLRRCARKLVFDFDDAIFCNSDGSYSRTRMRRFAAMARRCDHIFAGNSFLAEKARAFNASVSIVPTCLNTQKYDTPAVKPHDSIDLVWIGSKSTRKYLADALPALGQAAGRVANLRLKIIADFDLPEAPLPTVFIRWRDDTEAMELASAHIGIAPMRDDDWSRGKCALKVLQYMAAGLPVVSSNAGVNADAVSDGESGFLVDADEQWADAIARLAEDEALRARMGTAGRERVTDYAIEAVFARMQPILARLAAD